MKRILIVDDDEDIREALRDILANDMFQILLASHGRDALEILEQERHLDLVILDMMMPVMNGEEFMNAINADGRFSNIPVLIMSAGERYDERAMELGAKCFLRKPLDLRVFIREVHTCIGIHRAS